MKVTNYLYDSSTILTKIIWAYTMLLGVPTINPNNPVRNGALRQQHLNSALK
jgi:hypothetical protein